jgi:hypothetical protein
MATTAVRSRVAKVPIPHRAMARWRLERRYQLSGGARGIPKHFFRAGRPQSSKKSSSGSGPAARCS